MDRGYSAKNITAKKIIFDIIAECFICVMYIDMSNVERSPHNPVEPPKENPTKKAKFVEVWRRRKPVAERAVDLSTKIVDGYFDGITTLRCTIPRSLPLLSWEKWYFEEYAEELNGADPKKKQTWRDLREEGIDSRKMLLLSLQDKHAVPEKLLKGFVEQATTE
jgi:hypothetical protein